MRYLLLITYSLILFAESKAQNDFQSSTASVVSEPVSNWTTRPFENKVFVENKGQFDNKGQRLPIQYGINSMGQQIYFTSKGLIFQIEINLKGKLPYEGNGALSEEEQEYEGGKHNPKKNYTKLLNMEWLNANPEVEIIAVDKVPEYYTYGSAHNNESHIASAYKKIIYKNLYPNIDVEYIFHQKEGIKYSIILNPGADVTKISMKYSGADKIYKGAEGNIFLTTPIGDIIDHAPFTFYESNNSPISSAFKIDDNIISFSLGTHDSSRKIVIDPWTVVPGFTFNRAYDVNHDLKGNVYVHGSFNPFQLSKFNSAGALVWTYTCPATFGGAWGYPTYGDFTVDEVTGTSYIVEGSRNAVVLKVNTLGVQTKIYPGNASSPMNEMWRCEYSRCSNMIVIGGGSTNGNYQTAMLDTNMTTLIPINVLGATKATHDVSILAVDPNSAYCYMGFSRSLSVDPLNFDNTMVKCPMPGILPTLWAVYNGHSFVEITSITYTKNHATSGPTCGYNGMACGPTYLYSYDGRILKKWDKISGTFIAQLNTGGVMFASGGLSVDECDNVYAAVGASIKKYNSSLILIGTYPLSNTCFDLKLGLNNKLYACGINFVSEITVSGNDQKVDTASTPSSGCACNGTATVTPACNSGLNSSYLWNPGGQTTPTATALCPGNYSVLITTGCSNIQKVNVTVTGQSGGLALNASQTNIDCRNAFGSATVTPSAGVLPYTYLWSNGKTTSTTTGLAAGTYSCTVTDANNCSLVMTYTIIMKAAPFTIYPDQTNISCTTSGSISLTVGAGGVLPYSYRWSNGASAPTASGLTAGNYTVTVSDASGCAVTQSYTISGSSPVSATFTQSSINVCKNTAVAFTHTGTIGTHLWTITPGTVSGTSINFSYTFLNLGTYTVSHTVSNAGCSNNVVQNVIVTNCTGLSATATGSAICVGLCASITSSGSGGNTPYTYTWSSGASTQNISPCPVTNTAYTVTIRDAAGVTATSVATVSINPPINASTTSINISCNGSNNGSATATGSGGTNPYTFKWSTGATGISTGSMSLANLVAGNYTVTVTDSKGCTNTSTWAITSPPPLLGQFAKGTANCIGCGCKEWIMVNASGGTTPYSYVWQDGNINRYKNLICPGPYSINIRDKNGCSVNVNLITP